MIGTVNLTDNSMPSVAFQILFGSNPVKKKKKKKTETDKDKEAGPEEAPPGPPGPPGPP